MSGTGVSSTAGGRSRARLGVRREHGELRASRRAARESGQRKGEALEGEGRLAAGEPRQRQGEPRQQRVEAMEGVGRVAAGEPRRWRGEPRRGLGDPRRQRVEAMEGDQPRQQQVERRQREGEPRQRQSEAGELGCRRAAASRGTVEGGRGGSREGTGRCFGSSVPKTFRGKVLPSHSGKPHCLDNSDSSSISGESSDDSGDTSDSSNAGDGDTTLTSRDLVEIREFLSLNNNYKLCVPKLGDRCQDAPSGYFTIFSDYIRSGLTIPPSPILVDVVHSLGVSFSQLTPNAINVFTGFQHRVTEFGLTPSVDLFHALFSARRVMPDSYIYLQPRVGCKFITSGPSNRGFWKERFFFIRDDGWNVPTQWSSGTRKIHLTECHRELESQCERLGLFAEMFNPLDMLSDSTKHSLAQVRSFKRKKVGGIPEARKDETSKAPGANKRDGEGQGKKTLTGPDAGGATGPDKPVDGQVSSEKNSERRSTTVNGDKRANAKKSSGTRELSPKGAAMIRIGGGRHLFVDGMNNQEKAGSYWDLSDTGLAWRKTKGIVSAYDMERLVPLPSMSLSHSLASVGLQAATLANVYRCREERNRETEKKLHEEITSLKEDCSRLKKECLQYSTHFEQRETAYQDMRTSLDKTMKEYAAEQKTGSKFLSSAVGKKFCAKIEEEAVCKYKDSAAFEEETLERSSAIHDAVILDCRRQLRETGLVPEEVVMMLQPDVLEPGDAEMNEVLDACLNADNESAEMIEALDDVDII